MLYPELKSINITDEELRRLQRIGSGGFGTVFADEKNNCAIKKYHDTVKAYQHVHVKNPCLKLRRRKFKRLNTRDKKIKYSDVSVELVYQGLKFVGVRKKLYHGKTLDEMVATPLCMKKEAINKLIRNAKELTDNRIYTLDYKPKNVLITECGEIKFFDLDDIFTKVTLLPNFYYRRKSLDKLKDTIIQYIYSNQFHFSSSVAEMITSSPENNPTLQKKKRMNYDDLREFANSIQMAEDLLIIKSQDINKIDLITLKKYIDDNGLFLVLAFDNSILFTNEKAIDLIQNLNNSGIDVYDVFKYSKDYEKVANDYVISHESISVHSYDEKFKLYRKK